MATGHGDIMECHGHIMWFVAPGSVTLERQRGHVMWSIVFLRLISMDDEQMAVLLKLFGVRGKAVIANLQRTIGWF